MVVNRCWLERPRSVRRRGTTARVLWRRAAAARTRPAAPPWRTSGAGSEHVDLLPCGRSQPSPPCVWASGVRAGRIHLPGRAHKKFSRPGRPTRSGPSLLVVGSALLRRPVEGWGLASGGGARGRQAGPSPYPVIRSEPVARREDSVPLARSRSRHAPSSRRLAGGTAAADPSVRAPPPHHPPAAGRTRPSTESTRPTAGTMACPAATTYAQLSHRARRLPQTITIRGS